MGHAETDLKRLVHFVLTFFLVSGPIEGALAQVISITGQGSCVGVASKSNQRQRREKEANVFRCAKRTAYYDAIDRCRQRNGLVTENPHTSLVLEARSEVIPGQPNELLLTQTVRWTGHCHYQR